MSEQHDRPRRMAGEGASESEREVSQEFAFHLELRVAELVEQGLDPDEARAEALRGFGDMEAVRRRCGTLAREREGLRRRRAWIGSLHGDLVHGLRQLRAHPLLTGAVMLTLALGIGGVTALFSVVDAVLLRPLPYDGGERIVRIHETWRGFERGRASTGHYLEWRARGGTLEEVAAYDEASFNVVLGDEPERLIGAMVTPSYFRVLDAPPALGRFFTEAEGRHPAAPVAVLGWSTWWSRFGGDPAALGSTLLLNDVPHTVVGITPADFVQVQGQDQVFVPAAFPPSAADDFDSHGLLVLARHRADATLSEVRREMERLTAGIAERAPQAMVDRGVFVARLQDELVRNSRPAILALFAAVGFVLLMAAVNVASLLLARGSGRRAEVAVRVALGASRARLIRLFLTESLLLALLGGAGGLLVAFAGVEALRAVATAQGIPRVGGAGLDATALLFAGGLALLCGVGFGMAPALRSTRGTEQALRAGGRGGPGRRDRLRASLVVLEVACALTLLVAAGLLLRSAALAGAVPLGIRADGVMTAQVALPAARFSEPADVVQALGSMLDRLARTPGVRAAALVSHLPLTGVGFDSGVDPEGATYDASTRPSPHMRAVSPAFMTALGMDVATGRALVEEDFRAGAAPVVMINEELARRLTALYPEGGSVVGRRLAAWEGDGSVLWRTVIGVVRDVRMQGPEAPPVPELYLPYTHVPDWFWGAVQRTVGLAARSADDPLALTPALRAAVAEVDPELPLFAVRPLEDVVARAGADRRFTVSLFAMFSAVALILAVVGIYGVVAFLVGERTREIGVRQALGATAGHVVRLVVGQGARLAALGLLLGTAGGLVAGNLLEGLLYGVAPTDHLAWLLAVVVLGAAALAASAVPAVRAVRVPPTQALR